MLTSETHLDPVTDAQSLLRLNTAYFKAKVLQSAVELDLFGLLASGPATASEIFDRLRLASRLSTDFLDALVGLGLLEREDGRYCNSELSSRYLVPTHPDYLGGSIAQHSRLHFHAWGKLTEALRDGKATSGLDVAGRHGFSRHYTDLDRARRLMDHMDTFNSFVAAGLGEAVDWNGWTSVSDIGGARGNVLASLIRKHPHLCGVVFDLPGLRPLFDEHMVATGTAEQISFSGGDFFDDPLPRTDVMIIGHVLHDWPAEARRRLVARTFDAVNPGGALMIYDAMLDDDRRDADSLLQSLNCGIIRDGGSEYTVGEASAYVRDAGYTSVEIRRLHTLTSDRVLIAGKPR
ncbi:methyltransferase [Micromonospora sp. PTRAS2]